MIRRMYKASYLLSLKWLLSHISGEQIRPVQKAFVNLGTPKFTCTALYNVHNFQNFKIGNMDAELIIPPNPRENSMMVYWHGGGYVFGSYNFYRAHASRLAVHSRLPVLVPNYHLAPDFTFPSQILESLETYSFVQKNFNPAKILVAGDSAGGNLSLASLLVLSNPELFRTELEKFSAPGYDLDGDTKSFFKESLKKYESQMDKVDYSAFKGCVCFSPWLDLSHGGDTLAEYSALSGDPILPPGKVDVVVRSFLSKHKDLRIPESLKSSPLVSPGLASREARQNLPRTLIHAGDADMLVYDMFKFAVDCDKISLRTFPGNPHVFQLFPNFIFPDGEVSMQEVADFVDSIHLID